MLKVVTCFLIIDNCIQCCIDHTIHFILKVDPKVIMCQYTEKDCNDTVVALVAGTVNMSSNFGIRG